LFPSKLRTGEGDQTAEMLMVKAEALMIP